VDFLYAQSSSGGGILGFLPFILIFVVIYFLMLRPQMKQQKEHRKLLENLKKGDKVITSGGIHGTIAGFKEKNSIVVLMVDKNMKLSVNKSAISGLTSNKE
jgi:preprotein translocase subunit YajC